MTSRAKRAKLSHPVVGQEPQSAATASSPAPQLSLRTTRSALNSKACSSPAGREPPSGFVVSPSALAPAPPATIIDHSKRSFVAVADVQGLQLFVFVGLRVQCSSFGLSFYHVQSRKRRPAALSPAAAGRSFVTPVVSADTSTASRSAISVEQSSQAPQSAEPQLLADLQPSGSISVLGPVKSYM